MEKTAEKSNGYKKAKKCFLPFFCSKRAVFLCWFILFAASFLILFVHGISYLDPDFGWHLRVGKDIVQTGNVPTTEEYTYPTEGQSWVDHEWASNALLYCIFDSSKYGFWFLGVFFSLVAVSCFVLVAYITKKIVLPKTDPWKYFFYSALMIFVGTYSLLSAFGIRLQVLTWLMSLLLVTLLATFYQQNKLWPLFVSPLLLWIWSNLHGTFVTGIMIFGAFVFYFLFISKKTLTEKSQLATSFVFSIVATLATPYAFQLWKLVFDEYTQNRGYLQQIKEWMPMYAAPYIEWYSAMHISLFLALFAIAILSRILPKKRQAYLYIAFVLGLLLLSVQSRRFLPLFTFFSFPLSIYILINIFPTIKIKKLYAYLLSLIFVFFIVVKIDFIRTVPLNLFEQNIESSPYHAVLFIKQHPELKDLKIYNQYGWGGYLDWVLPEKKLFIDGRMPQKPLDGDQTFLDEYLAFRQADTMIKQIRKYDIELILIPQHKPRKEAMGIEKHLLEDFFMVNLEKFNQEDPLNEYLRTHWQQIYSDDVALIYLHPDITFQANK